MIIVLKVSEFDEEPDAAVTGVLVEQDFITLPPEIFMNSTATEPGITCTSTRQFH